MHRGLVIGLRHSVCLLGLVELQPVDKGEEVLLDPELATTHGDESPWPCMIDVDEDEDCIISTTEI
jgi:hypothetical protein